MMVRALPAVATLGLLLLIAQPDAASARLLGGGSRAMEANASGQVEDESQHQATMPDMMTTMLLRERQAQSEDSKRMDLDGTLERKCNAACQARNRAQQAAQAAARRAAEEAQRRAAAAAAAARRAAEEAARRAAEAVARAKAEAAEKARALKARLERQKKQREAEAKAKREREEAARAKAAAAAEAARQAALKKAAEEKAAKAKAAAEAAAAKRAALKKAAEEAAAKAKAEQEAAAKAKAEEKARKAKEKAEAAAKAKREAEEKAAKEAERAKKAAEAAAKAKKEAEAKAAQQAAEAKAAKEAAERAVKKAAEAKKAKKEEIEEAAKAAKKAAERKKLAEEAARRARAAKVPVNKTLVKMLGKPTHYESSGCRKVRKVYSKVESKDGSTSMSIARCFSFCSQQKGASYFGVANGDKCWCGAAFDGVETDSSHCEKPCPGKPDEMCGGILGTNVYVMMDCQPDTFEEKTLEGQLKRKELVSQYRSWAGESCGSAKDNIVQIDDKGYLQPSTVENCKLKCWLGKNSEQCHGFTYDELSSKCTFHLDVSAGKIEKSAGKTCYFKKV